MSKRIYNKPPKTFQEQLQQLKDRNLTVEDDVKALSILTNISYYRLSTYFLAYQSKKDWFDNNLLLNKLLILIHLIENYDY